MKSTIKLMTLVIALGLAWAGAAQALQVNPPPAGFLITGFIQEATLDGTVGGKDAIPKANTDGRRHADRSTIGNPVIPCNFQDFPFLANGDNYAGFQFSRLDSWPGP